MRAHGDRGQVLPLVALVVVLGAIVILVIGRVGVAVRDQARAQTAADAAALAGAAGGEADAESLAARNGAALLSFERDGAAVRVVVRVGRAQAAARAVVDST